MTAPILPELALLSGGAFVMGKERSRIDESPAHGVILPPFRAAVRPVSNAEYRNFVAATGYVAPPFWDAPSFSDPAQPVAGVSWHDAMAYCVWLSRVTGDSYRLPTEAEREFAARGGIEGADWPWGDPPSEQRDAVGREVASLDQPHVPRAECGNAYGLLCMADNLHEWCSDWYAPDYYAASPEESPAGPADGARRSSRGGSWRHLIKFNRTAARSSLDPAYRYNDYGFRLYSG